MHCGSSSKRRVKERIEDNVHLSIYVIKKSPLVERESGEKAEHSKSNYCDKKDVA